MRFKDSECFTCLSCLAEVQMCYKIKINKYDDSKKCWETILLCEDCYKELKKNWFDVEHQLVISEQEIVK